MTKSAVNFETFNNNQIIYESNGDKYRNLSLHGFLDKTRPYSKDLFKRSDNTWKIQLSVETKLRSSKNTCKEAKICLKSEKITIMVGNVTTELIKTE